MLGILKGGFVTVSMRSVSMSHVALRVLIPVKPPMPALRMMASILGVVTRSLLETFWMDRKDVRSTCSAWMEIRRASSRFLLRGARRRRYVSKREIVSLLFVVSLVVMMSVKKCVAGRVSRNSSIRRQQVANPSPLEIRWWSAAAASYKVT